MKTKTMTASEVLTKIETHAATHALRDVKLEIGQTAMQGDCYLTRVPDDWPRGKLLGTRKIAVGEGVGSNHLVEGDVEVYEGVKLPDGFKLPEGATIADMIGPVVVAGCETINTHPVHAHNVLHKGTYQVTQQWDMTTMRRVAD